MAYNDSGELPASQSTYSLGGYEFELKVQTVHEPGEEDVVSVYAICRGPDGNRETQAVDYPVGTTIENWRVECNETEATVYIKIKAQPLDTGNVQLPVPAAPYLSETYCPRSRPTDIISAETTVNGGVGIIAFNSDIRSYLYAAGESGAYYAWISSEGGAGGNNLTSVFTYNGKTVYYFYGSDTAYKELSASPSIFYSADFTRCSAAIAWTMVYGEPSDEQGDQLVGRFAIDIREADTEDWDEPGSDGPSGTTLNVTVTGATAGSCTGTPADNETVKGYGDGGDGGYGGGGGAGASTVIIHEFATDIAESVQQEAISRGPGTGGPGGKGGKGGDGCILIFY